MDVHICWPLTCYSCGCTHIWSYNLLSCIFPDLSGFWGKGQVRPYFSRCKTPHNVESFGSLQAQSPTSVLRIILLFGRHSWGTYIYLVGCATYYLTSYSYLLIYLSLFFVGQWSKYSQILRMWSISRFSVTWKFTCTVALAHFEKYSIFSRNAHDAIRCTAG